MTIGDLNIPNEIINCELRLGILERSLDFIMQNNSNIKGPSQSQITQFTNESKGDIQKKYPQLGVKFS